MTPSRKLHGCHVNLAPIFGLWRHTIRNLPEDAVVQPETGTSLVCACLARVFCVLQANAESEQVR